MNDNIYYGSHVSESSNRSEYIETCNPWNALDNYIGTYNTIDTIDRLRSNTCIENNKNNKKDTNININTIVTKHISAGSTVSIGDKPLIELDIMKMVLDMLCGINSK